MMNPKKSARNWKNSSMLPLMALGYYIDYLKDGLCQSVSVNQARMFEKIQKYVYEYNMPYPSFLIKKRFIMGFY